MWKLISVLYILLNSFVSSQICGNGTEFNCFCRTLIDERSYLPVSIADCSGKSIENIPSKLDDVNFLDLTLNNIQNLDPKLYKLSTSNLNTLILKHNIIENVDDEFFLTVPNLKELDLSHNRIAAINSPQLFQNLNHLVRIDLSYNKLKQLPHGIFAPLRHIRFLFIGYNAMGKFLMGSKNVLTKELEVSSNLTHLHMDNMGITEFHNAYFDEFKKMISLSVADNNLTTIPNFPSSLEKLDLSGNQLSYISGKYLNYHSLKVLKLNRMATLQNIHHYAFYNLEALEKLYIDDCPNLREFNYLAFDVASKNTKHHPKHFSFARNSLTFLNDSYKYYFKNMEFVDLSNNPWDCTCDILWLKDFETILHKPHEVKCHSPIALRNKRVLELKEEDMIECYPHIYGKQSHRILIVVLCIAIVLLCGLIFVLIKYPASKFLTNNRVVGPASPYSLASTSDSV